VTSSLFDEIDKAKILLEKYDQLVTILNFSGLIARKFIYLVHLEKNKLQAKKYLEQSKNSIQNHHNQILLKEIKNLENKISLQIN
jgi:large-conductance mechanosensitive channel